MSGGKSSSYYKVIAGVKYDRELLEMAQAAAADGQVSQQEAAQLLEAAQDGPGITAIERRTLEYILQEHRFTAKAAAFLRKGLDSQEGEHDAGARKKSSYYKVINKVRYDRELLEMAEKAAADGQISYPEAVELLHAAQDGPGITETERRTLEYIMLEYKLTAKASAALRQGLDSGREKAGGETQRRAAAQHAVDERACDAAAGVGDSLAHNDVERAGDTGEVHAAAAETRKDFSPAEAARTAEAKKAKEAAKAAEAKKAAEAAEAARIAEAKKAEDAAKAAEAKKAAEAAEAARIAEAKKAEEAAKAAEAKKVGEKAPDGFEWGGTF